MMKKILQTTVLLLCFGMQANATSVTLTSAYAWATPPCPTPVNAYLQCYGSAIGYAPTDNITVTVYWGDGTNSTASCSIEDSTGTGYFYSPGIPHTYPLAGTYTPLVIATGPDGEDDTLATSTLVLSTGCITIDGYLYTDVNSNCTYDAGTDTPLNGPVTVSNASGIVQMGYAGTDGYYSLTLPTGMTGLTITASSGLYTSLTCPAAGYSFSSSASASFDFGFICTSTTVDYYAHHTAYCGFGVPGGTGIMSLVAKAMNTCDGLQPATITVTMDPLITYTGMITGPAPTTVSGSVLTWNLNLAAGTAFPLIFSTATSTSAVVMSLSCFSIDITGPETDPNPANNGENICLYIGGPYDPNNKEVLPAGTGPEGYVEPGTEFEYTINFQNTGTAPAINVFVMDTLSEHLDMSTFDIIASSHAMSPLFTGSRIIRFDFPGINLPDSNTNEALSHGWIKYRIKARGGLASGTEIKNTAHIFFDYNPAIVTNTTLNTINTTLGTTAPEKTSVPFRVYPNPSGAYVKINAPGAEGYTAMVYDMTGKMLYSFAVGSAETTLDISSWRNGLYQVVIPQWKPEAVRFHKTN